MVSNVADLKTKRLYTACVAEFIGTLLLVLVGCGAVQSSNGTVLHISLAFGFTVATMVWMIGHISGGHINPAVTVGLVVTHRITFARGVLYAVSQTAGAIVGAALLYALTPEENPSLGLCTIRNELKSGQAFGIELLVTFVLVWVVFSSIDSNRSDIDSEHKI